MRIACPDDMPTTEKHSLTIAVFDDRQDAARARDEIVDTLPNLDPGSVRLLVGEVSPSVADDLRALPAQRSIDRRVLGWIGGGLAAGLIAGWIAEALGLFTESAKELLVGGLAGLAVGSLGALLTSSRSKPAPSEVVGRALQDGKAVLTVPTGDQDMHRSVAILRSHFGKLLIA